MRVLFYLARGALRGRLGLAFAAWELFEVAEREAVESGDWILVARLQSSWLRRWATGRLERSGVNLDVQRRRLWMLRRSLKDRS